MSKEPLEPDDPNYDHSKDPIAWIHWDQVKFIKPSPNQLGVILLSTKTNHYFTTRIIEITKDGDLYGDFHEIPEDKLN